MHRLLVFSLLFLFSQLVIAQDGKEYVTVKTGDGETVKGELIRIDQDSVVLRSASMGRVAFLKNAVTYKVNEKATREIRSIREEQVMEGDARAPYAFDDQYHVTQSAFPIRRNYYRNAYLVLNTVGIGLNKYLNISFTVEPFTSIGSRSLSGLMNVKSTFPVTDKLYIGGSMGIGTANGEIALLPSALLSYGTERKHMTVGVLTTIVEDEDNVLGVTMAGTTGLSKTVNIVGELLITGSGNTSGLLGVRKYFTGSKIAVDFSIVVVDDLSSPLPFIALTAPL